jgi:hypothetical protein
MAYRRYELTVRGQAASLVRAALPGFEIAERPPTTVIRGEVPDPATLEETIATVLRSTRPAIHQARPRARKEFCQSPQLG